MSKATILHYYESLLAEHGPSPRGVDYSSARTQHVRFAALLEPIHRGIRTTILDVGCGVGDLAPFVAGARYMGWDFSGKMIEAAIAKHGQDAYRAFAVRDIIFAPHVDTFDWVIASGLFQFADTSFFLMALAAMWERCRIGMAFNVLTSWGDRPPLHGEQQFDPARVLDHCRALTGKLMLRTDYLGAYDATVTLWR